jgi:chemotaxis protein methyltransferase CheR
MSNHDVIVQAIELIENRIGIAVGKQYHDEFTGLFTRLAQHKPQQYIQQLRTLTDSSTQWQRLINTLTIGETYFLREEAHFTLLKKHILPKLILERRQAGQHHLRIWSAGCASGEEAYSLAITLHQFLPDIGNWHIEIHGTDINEYAIKTARHAIYRDWAFRKQDVMLQQNYFNKVSGGLKLKPIIRNMVTFRQHNLLHQPPGQYDIIFCKNVLLYFEETYVKQAETHLYNALKPKGWLFLGQAEALRSQRDHWQTHIFPGTPIYQRPESSTLTIDIDHRHQIDDEDETQPSIPQDDNADYYNQAVMAIHQDDNTLAEHYLSIALSHHHQTAKSHTLLAWLFANRKAFPEAEAHIAATLSINPLHADAHYVTAMIALEQNKLEDSLRALQMALYCDKYHAMSAFMLGNLYAKSGQLTKAFSQWTKIQHAISTLEPTDYVSDLSDLTAGQLDAMINAHLKDV